MGRKVLVLAAHTDDAELGCGGAIARHVEAGDSVHVIAFSTCGRKDLTMEANAAGRVMGSTLQVWDFEVRQFARDRQKILDILIGYRGRYPADLVYMPCSMDKHQDHEVVHNEGFRAFKHCSILGYELPWNCRALVADQFTPLDRTHLDRKIAAIAEYKSQAHRPYTQPDMIEAQAKVKGLQCGAPFAEAFEVIRTIQ